MGSDPCRRAQAHWSRRRRAMIARVVAGLVVLAAGGSAAGGGPPHRGLPAGTISGKVTYTGTLPKLRQSDMSKEPNCAPPIRTPWDQPEFFPVKCTVHPFMPGYFVVLATPHSAVTDSTGEFS